MSKRISIGHHYPVTDLNESVITLLQRRDWRSEWRWFRLNNGDLILGFFPQADGYEAMETIVDHDYEAADPHGIETLDLEPDDLIGSVTEDLLNQPEPHVRQSFTRADQARHFERVASEYTEGSYMNLLLVAAHTLCSQVQAHDDHARVSRWLDEVWNRHVQPLIDGPTEVEA